MIFPMVPEPAWPSMTIGRTLDNHPLPPPLPVAELKIWLIESIVYPVNPGDKGLDPPDDPPPKPPSPPKDAPVSRPRNLATNCCIWGLLDKFALPLKLDENC